MKVFLLSLLALSVLFADSLSIIAVGDIMMGTTYPQMRLPPDDGKDIFKEVQSILSSADLTLGNLEGPLTDRGNCTKIIEKGRCYAFKTPPHYAQYLSGAGFDFMNLKNNHTNDFGPEGIASTIEALKGMGIDFGTDKKNGEFFVKNRKVGIICFSAADWGNSIFDIHGAQKKVAELARKFDIVIVSFHGGGEGTAFLHTMDTFEYFMGWPRGNVVKFAHAVIDSGADFVWGHGPHVPRALELYKNRLIAYSLGNFFTWGFNLNDERGYAPILKVVLDSTGVFKWGQVFSAIQRTLSLLKLDSLHNAAKLIKRLTKEDFPDTPLEITGTGLVLPINRLDAKGD
uniref:CapA family protein n=1 Tax=candidate division WOR-3 bacterium TaxID=2052148 RepID=A0A7C4TH92_UNCW3